MLKVKACRNRGIILLQIPMVEYDVLTSSIIRICLENGIEIPDIKLDFFDYRNLDAYSPDKLEEMRNFARSFGGECLSHNYINVYTKLRWKCSEGHEWDAIPKTVKKGHWCPYCAGVVALTIDEIHAIAQLRGGECLSKKYVNQRHKLRWKCSEGHEWEAQPNGIKVGQWCPYCAGHIKLTIEQMQEIARSRGGRCLSKKYINSSTKLKWQCSQGHIWQAQPNNIKSGKWCPICAQEKHANKLRDTIENMHNVAGSRGGKCLSIKYVNNRTKLRWQCSEGHIWENSPGHIKAGQWCPICFDKRRGETGKDKIENILDLSPIFRTHLRDFLIIHSHFNDYS